MTNLGGPWSRRRRANGQAQLERGHLLEHGVHSLGELLIVGAQHVHLAAHGRQVVMAVIAAVVSVHGWNTC